MLVHARLLYSRFFATFKKIYFDGSSEKLFDAGELDMIRSLFDTEDEKKDEKTVENKITETPLNQGEVETTVTENVENTELSKSENSETNLVSSEISVADESEQAQNLTISDEIPENPNSETISDFEAEEIVKDIEYGDNFLELEKEFARIEEEVRQGNEANLAEKTEVENIVAQEAVSDENSTESVKKVDNQAGIFTSAINKSNQEKQISKTVENSKDVPEIEAKTEVLQDESLKTSDVSKTENQGFILPNRVENSAENSVFGQATETPAEYKTESKAAIIRNSGLAWSAGIAFFGSVVFLLILGWFADLLLGTSPFMAVGGVILGSIIGFIQFFRLTSQILKDNQ